MGDGSNPAEQMMAALKQDRKPQSAEPGPVRPLGDGMCYHVRAFFPGGEEHVYYVPDPARYAPRGNGINRSLASASAQLVGAYEFVSGHMQFFMHIDILGIPMIITVEPEPKFWHLVEDNEKKLMALFQDAVGQKKLFT